MVISIYKLADKLNEKERTEFLTVRIPNDGSGIGLHHWKDVSVGNYSSNIKSISVFYALF